MRGAKIALAIQHTMSLARYQGCPNGGGRARVNEMKKKKYSRAHQLTNAMFLHFCLDRFIVVFNSAPELPSPRSLRIPHTTSPPQDKGRAGYAGWEGGLVGESVSIELLDCGLSASYSPWWIRCATYSLRNSMRRMFSSHAS